MASEGEALRFDLLYTLYGHARGVTCVEFSGDGARLATGGADGLVQVWHARSGRLVQTLEGHEAGVNDVCWTRDYSYVASASDDRIVRLWNAGTVRASSPR